jgi:hypothetical protein
MIGSQISMTLVAGSSLARHRPTKRSHGARRLLPTAFRPLPVGSDPWRSSTGGGRNPKERRALIHGALDRRRRRVGLHSPLGQHSITGKVDI